MASIDDILEMQPDRYIDEEYKRMLIEFIRSNPSVARETITFIKRITKLAHRIYVFDKGAIEPFLERIIAYHEEGIEKIRHCIGVEGEENIETMERHLLSHMGVLCLALFKKGGSTDIAKKGYYANRDAGVLCCEPEPLNSACSYRTAGDTASSLYKRTKEIKWLEDAYTSFLKAAERFEFMAKDNNLYLSDAMGCYREAASAAKRISERVKDAKEIIAWKERYYEAGIKHHMLYKSEELKAENGDNAYHLFKLTQLRKWATSAVECYEGVLEYFKGKNQGRANLISRRINELKGLEK